MAFTSSTANKNNKFHIKPRGPGAGLLIVVKETLVFNFLETGIMRIPAIPVEPKDLENINFQLENIKVDRVLCSTCRENENLLQQRINGKPEKVISCSIKDISIIDRIIPLKQNKQVLAIAIYQYTIVIRYLDFDGKDYTIDINSGSRYERITSNSYPSRLQVTADAQCVFTKLYPK